VTEQLITLDNVTKHFQQPLTLGDRIAGYLGSRIESRPVQAVSNVSLTIKPGETLGLVGESGCGKSTLGRMIAGILPVSRGDISLEGNPVMHNGKKSTTKIQTVFQDPFASLNARMRIEDLISEGPVAHGIVEKNKAKDFAKQWLERVGLDGDYSSRYPHQFSGGQRQRVAIARALAMEPDLLVCDEAVASLDVSIQAQVINLFLKLRRELNITCLFISHDLGVVRHISDRVAIMYLGKIVELGTTDQVYENPCHPYTKALLESVPKLTLTENANVEFKAITGEIPSPINPPNGCYFNPRCNLASAECHIKQPELTHLNSGQEYYCHNVKITE